MVVLRSIRIAHESMHDIDHECDGRWGLLHDNNNSSNRD